MRILIIKTSAMGDIIHALPVLDYLHQAIPDAAVDWIVEEPFKDVLAGNPLLHRLHIIRTRKWRKSIFSAATRHEAADVLKSIRDSHYDMAIDIQGNLKSGVLAGLSGAPRRFGFTRKFQQEKLNALFTNYKIPHRPQDDNAGKRYLRIVSAALGRDYAGMNISTQVHTGEEDNRTAKQLLAGHSSAPVFLFHGGTTWQTKFWSEEGWIALGKNALAAFPGSMILLSWGNETERTSAQRVAAGIGPQARLLDRYTLKGITAVIKQVDLVIGGDTGLVHLAAAVGTPTVSYYRSSDGNASGPDGDRHIIVQSPLPCTRCFRTSCERDGECRDSIRPETILAGMKTLSRFFRRAAGSSNIAVKGNDR